MAERHTHEEWRQKLLDPATRLTLEEFRAIEAHYAAGALLRLEKSWMQTQPEIRRLSAGYMDMLSVWLVALTRWLIRRVPWMADLPPYPSSLVGRMDLREAQAVVAVELQRRAEIIDGVAPTAEMLVSLVTKEEQSGGGG